LIKQGDLHDIIYGRIGLDGTRKYGIGIDSFRWWALVSDS